MRTVGLIFAKRLDDNIKMKSPTVDSTLPPLLTIVVLGYRNFAETTGPCLESLTPWIEDPAIEILVVDNSSPDGAGTLTRQWCEAHPRVRCLSSDTNRGYAGGMNWGATQAHGQWLFLVNNDTVFPDHALDALKRVVSEAPPRVAMIGPVTNSAGNGQRLWKPDASHADWMDIGTQLHANPTYQLMPAYRCDFFCVAIRRDVWNQLGGLDTSFGLGYYEDFDFSLRLSKAGWEQKITEDVFVLHAGSATFKGSKEAKQLLKNNKKLIQKKHPDARFEHTRLGNLAILQTYLQLQQSNMWTPALAKRLDLRLSAVFSDSPRSFFRRWRWVHKSKAIVAALQSENRIG
jgi:GT2 family glycosyltransferase